MKTKMKKIMCILMAVVLCLGMSVPTMAASSKYRAAVKTYNKYVKCNKGNGKIVDVDSNGVPELLFHNQSKGRNEVYTYNTRTKKMKCLVSCGYGKADSYPIKYSRSKHTVLVMQADTGGSRIYVYKLKGLKKTRLLKATYENRKSSRDGQLAYWLNGKKTTKVKYDKKLNSYMKYMTDMKVRNQY